MSGKPNITVAYPAVDSDGTVRAVVFVGVDLAWLNGVFAEVQMPPESVLTAIDSAVVKYRPLTEKKNLRIKTSVEPRTGSILADLAKIERLIGNLLSNAIKFTADGGRIEMGARKQAGGVGLWVSDTGVVMAQDEVRNLFVQCRQTASGQKSIEPRTDLGLLICKRIAESHGGRI